ncbi:EAL domain-containing protein [Stenotrophomonas sp. HITSZ_GD]|uniref:bifunctional diguanylate cyclase/phosphodiesterase n=1 Tax=Stenotrophomonas sp. HITSZ_GD TaxID=3037248 RepID=UPI00240E68A4|nr:EAL domain-containing protein [Stenotrophomonas sp. HITSZ_GD]MDG2525178.1 EAL domain-containing protein [Stenotrophomonas sp. HITSZ_GD]
MPPPAVAPPSPPAPPDMPHLRRVTWAGIVLGVLLCVGLALVLAHDWHARSEAAQRQAMALATGTQRLMALELRNLERAMRGIAGDAHELFSRVPEQAPDLLSESMRGVVSRHAEIESIVVVDDHGRALTDGRSDRTLADWAVPARRGGGSDLYIGAPERGPDGEWLLRLAVDMGDDRWVLTRLRRSELQRLIADLDVGRRGVVSMSDAEGWVLARSADPPNAHANTPSRMPPGSFPPTSRILPMGEHVSVLDGTRRIAAAGTLPPYPIRVYAGLDKREVLAPWWTLFALSVGVLACYVAGFVYLLRSLRRAARRQMRLQADLRAGDEELRLAHQAGGIGTWSIAPDGRQLLWSTQAAEIFLSQLPGLTVEEFLERVHTQDRRRLIRALARAWRGEEPLDMTFRLQLPELGERWVSVRGALVPDGHPSRRMTGTVVDISERVEIQSLALDAQRQFRLIFELSPLPCWLFDAETGMFLEVNPAAVREYGYTREEFLRMHLADIEPALQDRQHAPALSPADDSVAPLLHVHRRRNGSLMDVRVHTSQLEIAGIRARLALAENVSDHMAYQRELAYRASHDAATGLLTVRALAEWLDREQGQGRYHVAHVELRGLQLIGDTLGRETGEAVLRNLKQRLKSLADRYGWLAFQPAEDFVFAIAGQHALDMVVEVLVASLSEPVQGRDSFHQLDLRIGVASHPDDGGRAEEVIAKAAQAAHAAREESEPVVRFHAGIEARLSERLRLAGRLHQAIDRHEFVLHFQPITHCRSRQPVALEALLRWQAPDGSWILPGEFIQLCEDTGLILPLGRWALREAARAQRRLAEHGWRDLPIAVNVSALQFHHSDLAADVAAACEEHGVARGGLHVELTESSLMRQPLRALKAMHGLHAQGVCISLDDFGTGFSSMSYLQHMPLDSLKIDRSFVVDVEREERNASICRALITLGHNLGLKVIAEGVEHEAQLQWLATHGCDQVQGWLLGRPAPLEQVLAMMRRAPG